MHRIGDCGTNGCQHWGISLQPPFHRLDEFVPLTPGDVKLAEEWSRNTRRIARNETIRREGEPVAGVFFLLEGWVGSSVMLRDGRRQMAKIHLPGDMLGFPSLALAVAGETLEAITDVTLCPISTGALGRMFQESVRLTAGIFLSTQRERVALMQELSWIGSTSAFGRLAAFLVDLHDRLSAAGMVEEGAFPFPLTQQHIGELLGLTSVHVNRMLRRLDATGYIERGKKQLRVIDLDGLRSLAPNLAPRLAGREGWERLGLARPTS
jgi:CRP/FNR family transcriptional regulator, anaerobic regulatory protein